MSYPIPSNMYVNKTVVTLNNMKQHNTVVIHIVVKPGFRVRTFTVYLHVYGSTTISKISFCFKCSLNIFQFTSGCRNQIFLLKLQSTPQIEKPVEEMTDITITPNQQTN